MVSAVIQHAAFGLGVVGQITSLFLFWSPLPTFYKIIKTKTVGEFSGIPYSITLFNCALWIFYGLPFVTQHNILVVTINGVGFVSEFIYIILFLVYGTSNSQKKLSLLTIGLMAAYAAFVVGVMLGTHTLPERKLIVGILCLAINICMYASPLTVMRNVIITKSTEYMPFTLSLACFLNGALWFVYGLLMGDIWIEVPNGVGILFSLAQLILYATYYKRKPVNKVVKTNPRELQEIRGGIGIV